MTCDLLGLITYLSCIDETVSKIFIEIVSSIFEMMIDFQYFSIFGSHWVPPSGHGPIPAPFWEIRVSRSPVQSGQREGKKKRKKRENNKTKIREGPKTKDRQKLENTETKSNEITRNPEDSQDTKARPLPRNRGHQDRISVLPFPGLEVAAHLLRACVRACPRVMSQIVSLPSLS